MTGTEDKNKINTGKTQSTANNTDTSYVHDLPSLAAPAHPEPAALEPPCSSAAPVIV